MQKKQFVPITGRARLTCDIDERWNGPPPRCEPILCDPPTPVPHSYIQIDEIDETETVPSKTNFSRSLLVGSIVTYTCEKGYRLSGFRQILCLPTGLYDHVAPTCTGMWFNYFYGINTNLIISLEKQVTFRGNVCNLQIRG